MLGQVKKSFGFFKTTAIGGALFLLPLFVVLALLVYVYEAVVTVHQFLQPWIPLDSATGFVLLFGVAIAVLLVSCFVAGLAARRAIGARFSGTVEKQLLKVMPKYGIYKDLLAGKLGGDENVPSLRPVLIRQGTELRLAFQADRLENGLVVTYFPGSPDTWNGSLAFLDPKSVEPLNVSFAEVVEIFERLGRDSNEKLRAAIVAATQNG